MSNLVHKGHLHDVSYTGQLSRLCRWLTTTRWSLYFKSILYPTRLVAKLVETAYVTVQLSEREFAIFGTIRLGQKCKWDPQEVIQRKSVLKNCFREA